MEDTVMARRTTYPAGAPCWIDLYTSDTEASRRFYTELLGWTAEDPNPDFGGYFNFRKDGVRVAGCMGRQPGLDAPDHWGVHLAAADAAKTVEAAAAHGAQVTVQPMAVADLGVMAQVIDPGGAAVGIWQAGKHPGAGILYEPGVPTWFELHARSYDAALDFYKEVFGWTVQTMSDAPEFRYSIVVDGEDRLAGVMDDAAAGVPGSGSQWLVYFGFDDADAAVVRAQQLGATIARPAEDTPYGKLASVIDPTGAPFNIMAPNEAMPFRTREKEAAGQQSR
jgi:uncharacterized protein